MVQDLLGLVEKLNYLSGVYTVELIIGDAAMVGLISTLKRKCCVYTLLVFGTALGLLKGGSVEVIQSSLLAGEPSHMESGNGGTRSARST